MSGTLLTLEEFSRIKDFFPPATPRDWEKDFNYENGSYYGTCSKCSKTFRGHKRRSTCALCAKDSEE